MCNIQERKEECLQAYKKILILSIFRKEKRIEILWILGLGREDALEIIYRAETIVSTVSREYIELKL